MLLLALGPLVAAAGPGSIAPGAAREDAELGARHSQAEEYELKAFYLLHFIRFTTWPEGSFEDDQSPIVLAVLGDDPFGRILDDTFRGEKVGGRRVEIRRLEKHPERLQAHLVFFGAKDSKSREKLIAACRTRPILLVGESEGFAQDGACVNFYLKRKKVRFEINTDALATAGLEVSSELLKLARIVRSRKR